MTIFIIILIILSTVYCLSTVGRTGHKGYEVLQGWYYAHRGLHGNGVPENSMEAFQRAKQAGYGVELDVHLLKDGQLAVIHDASLRRTTGQDGYIEDLTAEDLPAYFLESSQQTIPLLSQVLDLYRGEAPLIVELKCERNNYAQLCQTVCQLLDDYHGAYCLESFDPRCIYWLRKNRPDLIRGQLTENYFRSPGSKLSWYLKALLSWQMLNFLTLPDFVSYKFRDRKHISNFFCRRLWHLHGVTWTVRSQEELDLALEEGWLPIFEGFIPES